MKTKFGGEMHPGPQNMLQGEETKKLRKTRKWGENFKTNCTQIANCTQALPAYSKVRKTQKLKKVVNT